MRRSSSGEGVDVVRTRRTRRDQDCLRILLKEVMADSISTIVLESLVNDIGMNEFTGLQFNPRRSSTVTLNDTIHEELLTLNERVLFIVADDYRLPPAFDIVESTLGACVLYKRPQVK